MNHRLLQKVLLLAFSVCALFSLPSMAATPLPAEEAFVLTTEMTQPAAVTATFTVAPKYYLYRQKIKVAAVDPKAVTLGTIDVPHGKPHHDDLFGSYEALENQVVVTIPITHAAGPFNLRIDYQGCSSEGFCYPPQQKEVSFTPPVASTALTTGPETNQTPPARTALLASIFSGSSSEFTEALSQEKTLVTLLLFFVVGILLAATPCVLPMLPILGAIIVDQRAQSSPFKGFGLSLSYILGMSGTYAIAGIFAASIGETLQADLQQPWLIALTSAFFVLLALSLFGLFEFRLPGRLHNALHRLNQHHHDGSYLRAGFMGVLSTLMVSPCVTPPLVGALTFIGNTGNVMLGGSALFALGLGMGLPLMIAGTLGGRFLPKAGMMSVQVKAFLGFLLLGIAIYLLSRVINGAITLFLYGTLCVAAAFYFGVTKIFQKPSWHHLFPYFGVVLLLYGSALITGALLHNVDPFHPFSSSVAKMAKLEAKSGENIVKVTNLAQLNEILATAKSQQQPVILDFYADWCIACLHMERHVLPNPSVQHALKPYQLIKVDVTANDQNAKQLLKQFGVIAPPTLIILDASGHERVDARLVGEVSAKTLIQHTQKE
jgi:thiol:disulfide interchange protein DsbD